MEKISFELKALVDAGDDNAYVFIQNDNNDPIGIKINSHDLAILRFFNFGLNSPKNCGNIYEIYLDSQILHDHKAVEFLIDYKQDDLLYTKLKFENKITKNTYYVNFNFSDGLALALKSKVKKFIYKHIYDELNDKDYFVNEKILA